MNPIKRYPPENIQITGQAAQEKSPMRVLQANRVCFLLSPHVGQPKGKSISYSYTSSGVVEI